MLVLLKGIVALTLPVALKGAEGGVGVNSAIGEAFTDRLDSPPTVNSNNKSKDMAVTFFVVSDNVLLQSFTDITSFLFERARVSPSLFLGDRREKILYGNGVTKQMYD